MIYFFHENLIQKNTTIPFIKIYDKKYYEKIMEMNNTQAYARIRIFFPEENKTIAIKGTFNCVDIHQIGSIPFGWLTWYTKSSSPINVLDSLDNKNNLNFYNLCITGFICIQERIT